MEITLDVDVEAARERILGEHQEEAVVHDARVVDQHVYAAQLTHNRAEHVLDGGQVGGIGLHCQRAHAEALQLLYDRLRGGFIGNIVDGNVIAALGQCHGTGLTDAA